MKHILSMTLLSGGILLSALVATPAQSAPDMAGKTHPIHVRNKTAGRVDFQIRDEGSDKMLVESYLPISGACAVFPTDSTNNKWMVKMKKEGGTWTSPKSMQEVNGWIDLQ